MDIFQRTSSTVSLPRVQGVSAVQLCGSGMLAKDISNLLRTRSINGNLLQPTAITDDRLCGWHGEGSRKKKRTVAGEERAAERKTIDYHAYVNCLQLYHL